ncbi:TPA: fimbrial protein, partial [Citrobacter farmeri]|nr:fimbrial protein [Citrobacter farmeri]
MSVCVIQYRKRVNNSGILFMLMLFVFSWAGVLIPASATISHVNGLMYDLNEGPICPAGGQILMIGLGMQPSFKGNECTLTPGGGYVPHSGNYAVRLYVYPYKSTGTPNVYAESTKVWLDKTRPLSEQNVTVSSSDQSTLNFFLDTTVNYCYALVDDAGEVFTRSTSGYCAGAPPLPPDPPPPDTSCSINNNNNLNVAFGTIDRAQLSTEPGLGNIAVKNYQIPITCTGGIDVSVTMNLQQYTPLTMNGAEVIKTSANGVGVAVMYNKQPLSTADSVPITLVSGSNTLNLDFQAVRDPAVAPGDVPPGY